MRKIQRRLYALALALVMAASCTACGGGKTTAETSSSDVSADEFEGVEWTMAHTRTEDSRAALAAAAFAEAVEEKTDGKIKITVYGNSSLGDYSTVQERVSLGDVTMQMADYSPDVDSSLALIGIPYIISNWDEFDEYYHLGQEGAMMAEFAQERFALQNITVLGCYPQYFGSICSATPIENWEDPGVVKNLKCRVPTAVNFEKMAEVFGLQPVGMPASEAYTAMQTGIIDSMLGGGTEYYWAQMKDVVNYILPVNTHPVSYWMYINTDAFNAIPEEYQTLLYELADEYLYTPGLEAAKSETTMYEEYFAANGATVYEVTDEIQQAYADAYRENVWPLLATEDNLGEAGLEIFHQFMDVYGISY